MRLKNKQHATAKVEPPEPPAARQQTLLKSLQEGQEYPGTAVFASVVKRSHVLIVVPC